MELFLNFVLHRQVISQILSNRHKACADFQPYTQRVCEAPGVSRVAVTRLDACSVMACDKGDRQGNKAVAVNFKSPVITAFHASPHDDIASFWPGTHFGSRESAIERAAAMKFNDQEMTLYEVEVDLAKPLEIFDEGGSHTVEYLVSAIRGADRKALSRFAADAILRKAEQDGEVAGMSLLWEAMVGRGQYDGLVYENNTEGSGSLSWVIFRPAQVRIINIEALTLAERSTFG